MFICVILVFTFVIGILIDIWNDIPYDTVDNVSDKRTSFWIRRIVLVYVSVYDVDYIVYTTTARILLLSYYSHSDICAQMERAVRIIDTALAIPKPKPKAEG